MDRLPVSEAWLVRFAGVSAVLGGLLWAANVIFGEGMEGGGALSGLLSALPGMFAGGLAGMYLRYGIGSSPSAPGYAQGFAGLALLAGGFISDAAGFGGGEVGRPLWFQSRTAADSERCSFARVRPSVG